MIWNWTQSMKVAFKNAIPGLKSSPQGDAKNSTTEKPSAGAQQSPAADGATVTPPTQSSNAASNANTDAKSSSPAPAANANTNTDGNQPSQHPDGTLKPDESQHDKRNFDNAASMPGGGPESQKGVLAGGSPQASVDVIIHFISATVPKTDPAGKSDPYFKAELDEKMSYNSTAQKQTLEPVWNEQWHLKNIPRDALLRVKIYDKDENVLPDDYIGDFALTIGNGGESEHEIVGRMGRSHGRFKLNIIASPTSTKSTVPPYTFDGPCHYSRHKSPTVGALTALDTDERRYATWKIYMMGIPEFFGDTHQHWNEKYPAAKKIFDNNPLSATIRLAIHSGHKLLYARSTGNAAGVLSRAGDLLQLFKDETTNDRIKPAVYTYIINDDTWRFSETGAAFFVDFVSKHALHADVATQVRYSGEFHWRPVVDNGWAGFHNSKTDEGVEWELVIDNNSGTYSPDKAALPRVKALMEHNFPQLRVAALDHGDPELKKSTEALQTYAKEHRGISSHEFHAHEHFGSTTAKNIATKMGMRKQPNESDPNHKDEETQKTEEKEAKEKSDGEKGKEQHSDATEPNKPNVEKEQSSLGQAKQPGQGGEEQAPVMLPTGEQMSTAAPSAAV